jgi:hypothetical protein
MLCLEEDGGNAEVTANESRALWLRLAELLYLLTMVLSVYFLLLSRTGEAHTIWEVLHPTLLPALFVATSLLVAIAFSSEKTAYKIILIMLHSILFHFFFSIIFPVGDLSGQQMVLGRIRRLQDDSLIHGWPPAPLGSFSSEIFSRFGGINFQGALTVVLGQMLSLDLLPVHLFLVPFLWGVFTPVAVYLATFAISRDEKVSVLASLLLSAFPYATYFGAISVPNSLGFIFFFFAICFMLKYLSSDDSKTLALLLLFIFFAFFAHYLAGIISISLFLLAVTFKAYRNYEGPRSVAKVSLIFTFIVAASVLPFSLWYLKFFRPITQTGFTSSRLFELSSQQIIGLLTIGELVYTLDYMTIFLVLVGPAIAFLFMIYILFSKRKNPHTMQRTEIHFLVAAFFLVMVDYRILKLFMEGLPFNEERLWVFRDFLASPFVALAFYTVLTKLSSLIKSKLSETFRLSSVKSLARQGSFGILALLLASNLLVPVLIGGWATYSLNAAYPQLSVLQTTWYELEAVRSIDETTSQKYVVIGDLWTIYAGERIVGINNPRAYYFAEFDKTGIDLFTAMKQDPSPEWMQQAMNITNTSIAYFIITQPRVPLDEFTVTVTKAIQMGFRWRVLGEGKLYIFIYEKV